MRVIHVINSLGWGGAEKQLSELVARSSLEHEIVEFGPHSWASVCGLRDGLKSRRPDVVVGWLDRSQIAVAAATGRRWPLLASVRGLPRRGGAGSRWMLRAALARYDQVVTNSRASGDALAGFMRPLHAPSVTVIPNGVEHAPAMHASERAGPLRVGFIGRANRDKGIDVLLEALSQLDATEARAVLVGAGVPDAVARHRDPLPLVTALPPTDDPWDEMAKVDVLAVPSRSEGLPNVVLEAFARGVPVIATDTGGSAELVKHGRGYLIPSGDPSALSNAIRTVAACRRDALQRASRARLYVQSAHDWDRVVAMWEAVLRTLVR